MKIEITTVRNGLLVTIEAGPTASDPLAQRDVGGTWFAHNALEACGRISEAVQREYDRAPGQSGAS
jgi:hypothetical protein